MGSFNRKIPEKSKKEHDEELRAENRRLRKEVQQLRKELQKSKCREEDIEEIMQEFELELEPLKSNDRECPKCLSTKISIIENVREGKDYYLCANCGSRGRLK